MIPGVRSMFFLLYSSCMRHRLRSRLVAVSGCCPASHAHECTYLLDFVVTDAVNHLPDSRICVQRTKEGSCMHVFPDLQEFCIVSPKTICSIVRSRSIRMIGPASQTLTCANMNATDPAPYGRVLR